MKTCRIPYENPAVQDSASSVITLEFSTPFLRFSGHILSKFPVPDRNKANQGLSQEELLDIIQSRIQFVLNVIRPKFPNNNRNDGNRSITKSKLPQLWKSNRKCAIQIIHQDNRQISLYVQRRIRVDVGHVFGVKTNQYLKIKFTFEIFHQPAVKL